MKEISKIQEKNIWAALLPLALAAGLLFTFISISLNQIFLFLCFAIWLIMLIKDRKSIFFPAFFWPLLAYAALSLLASFFSVNPEISIKDSRDLLLFLIIPITCAALRTRNALRTATLAFLASGLADIFYSLFQYLFKAQPGARITGFMGHYMTQAGLLVFFCSVALSMFIFSRDKLKGVWALGFILAAFSLALTMTRSAWIGFVAVSALILFLYKPKTLVVIPVAIGLFFLISPQPMKRRALSIFSLKGYSNQQRIQYLKAGLKIIGERPWLGTGPDTVDMVFKQPKYGLSEEAKQNVHLHNNFTQIAAERGIPTLLAWLLFLGLVFFSLLKKLRNKDPAFYPHAAAALAALLALVISGFFEYNFGDSEITTLFLYLMSVPFAKWSEQVGSSPPRVQS